MEKFRPDVFWLKVRKSCHQFYYAEMEATSPDILISRTGKNAILLTAEYEASSINRAVAFYRYLAGIPMDKEPPASP
jgi:hypothetical protein